MLEQGEVFAGFTVERLLGQGGMGSVYLARHPRTGKRTALKLLNRELFTDQQVRARFEREADLVAQLDHPGIIAVYDRGSENDQLWISMQYVDGVDAASVNALTLPPERAVQIIEGVADALDYAHGRGVLHRDVKPANILLARASKGKGERVFLSDFGIARLREDTTHLTQTGMFTATLAYASPEQMTGAPLGNRSDQYSLACALYWLLTGVGPFDADNPADIIHGHLNLAAVPVTRRRPGLNPALDLVLAAGMAKLPDHRYRTCAEFAAAARKALTAVGPPPLPAPVYPQQAPVARPHPGYPPAPGPPPPVAPVPRVVQYQLPPPPQGAPAQAPVAQAPLPAAPVAPVQNQAPPQHQSPPQQQAPVQHQGSPQQGPAEHHGSPEQQVPAQHPIPLQQRSPAQHYVPPQQQAAAQHHVPLEQQPPVQPQQVGQPRGSAQPAAAAAQQPPSAAAPQQAGDAQEAFAPSGVPVQRQAAPAQSPPPAESPPGPSPVQGQPQGAP
ncbi:serine/threonine-protein kinase, partial [Nocardia higoensis]|uniref:serine/threonine-protein kinase n=1 Tax=Nocardia higoensis TaxID=228599 RepID=UPI0012F69157